MKRTLTLRGPWTSASLLTGLLALAGLGCGPKSTPPPVPPAAASTNAARPNPPVLAGADAALMQAVADAAKPVTEADLAWQAIEKAMEPPQVSAELLLNDSSPDAIAGLMKDRGAAAAKAAELAKEFYTKYSKDDRAMEGRQLELELLGMAVESGHSNLVARLAQAEEALVADASVPEEKKLEVRVQQVQRTLEHGMKTNAPAAVARLEEDTRRLQKEFPARTEINALLLPAASLYLDQGNVEKARALAREISASGAPDDLKEEAAALLKSADRIGQPLAVQFKALDGREVNVQGLAGKVVLVDFWATWCGPCMAELPKVKATYEKLHPRGFEIVGISLDQERDALERVVAEKGIPWPQYFEGGPENRFASEFAIQSIPTLWLVDKKGRLRHLNAREDLEKKVEALLAE